MAEFKLGRDIFDEPGDLYVVTVNTVGVMGAGVAKAFADRYPELVERYKHDCRYRIITIGHPVVYRADDGKHFLMFPTKENWRNDSRYDYIGAGLQWMINNVGEEDGIDPQWRIVMPPLGCGNGHLNFDIVSEMIAKAAQDMPNPIKVVYSRRQCIA